VLVAGTRGYAFTGDGTSGGLLAAKAKVEACLKQSAELLPKVSVVEHINREVGLDDILGKERPPLEGETRADYDARRFVCEAGVGAMMGALLQEGLQEPTRCGRRPPKHFQPS